jgi:hypothetical protein
MQENILTYFDRLLALKLLPSQVLPLLPLPLEQAGMLVELVEMNGLQAEQLKNGVTLPLSQLSNGKSLTLYLHLAALLRVNLMALMRERYSTAVHSLQF